MEYIKLTVILIYRANFHLQAIINFLAFPNADFFILIEINFF